MSINRDLQFRWNWSVGTGSVSDLDLDFHPAFAVCFVILKHLFKSLYSFPVDVSAGLIEVVSPPASFYPDFSLLKSTFGDSKERVK